MKRIKDSLRDLWDNIKRTNIRIIGVPEEEEKKKGTEKIFEEIIVENFLNVGKILKAAREMQQITYKGIPIRLTADLSAETLQARREWQDIFKVMKGKNLQPRLLYSARISFRFDGEIKTFTDKQKLREFSTMKPALQQMLKELL